MDPKVKELLDRIRETASTAGGVAYYGLDAAGKKAGEVWDITKLKWKRTDLKADVYRLYRDVGEIVYATHAKPDAPTDALDSLLAALDEKHEAIEELTRRIEERRQGRVCPNRDCGAAVTAGDAFCRRCGATLRADADKADKEET
ncbi:MAG: zinc ribbon domain-containing protein [Oscillospiraceae bacterium]|jgi:hypothetical protein|nr:zinc ribbon domain-containing protein [Oscillospiraceae bacterium]